MDIIENGLTRRRNKTKLSRSDKKALGGVIKIVLLEDIEELANRAALERLPKTEAALRKALETGKAESPPRVSPLVRSRRVGHKR